MLFPLSCAVVSLYFSARLDPYLPAAFFLLTHTTTIGMIIMARRTGAPTPTAIPIIAPMPSPEELESAVVTVPLLVLPPPPLLLPSSITWFIGSSQTSYASAAEYASEF